MRNTTTSCTTKLRSTKVGIAKVAIIDSAVWSEWSVAVVKTESGRVATHATAAIQAAAPTMPPQMTCRAW